MRCINVVPYDPAQLVSSRVSACVPKMELSLFALSLEKKFLSFFISFFALPMETEIPTVNRVLHFK